MKYCITLLLILLSFSDGMAQGNNVDTDRRIMAIPEDQALSTDGIARYINKTFTSDVDKTRAAYTWVIHNIKYDTDSMFAINWNKGGSLKITESLRRRKGVCENFASIFIDIISKSGIQGVTIDGYTKHGNAVNKTGHTWAAVNLNNTWYFFDPTWDKDRLHDYHHFMVKPPSLASTHMPFDPLWQLTDSPITHREFHGESFRKAAPILKQTDSIKAFMRLGELEKLQATARRMQNADKISDLIRNRLAFLKMQIAVLYEDGDMHLYNAAVSDLNRVAEVYNRFVLKMNAQDVSSDLSKEYNNNLEPSLVTLNTTLISIADIGKYIPNDQYESTALKNRIMEMADKIRGLKPQSKTLTKNR